MKKISPLLALSVSTAVFCGLWSWLASVSGLFGWAGFAGCTTYFANGKHGIIGLKKAVIPNLAGEICGMLIIFFSSLFPMFGEWGIWCAVFTFVMCIISRWGWFDFCPGTFVGCFSVFAAGGNWKLLMVSMVLGAFLGLLCDCGGVWLQKAVEKN